jgi:hypothetical protein
MQSEALKNINLIVVLLSFFIKNICNSFLLMA